MKEFTSAVDEALAEEAEEEVYVPFRLDGRDYKAYRPNDTQLVFLVAAMGRGQTNESRFSSIVAIMLESLRGDDKDMFESRMITSDKTKKVPLKVVEGIFEYLTEEWFRPEGSGDGAAVRAGDDGVASD